MKPGAIVGALTGDGRIEGRSIGRTDIYPSFSLVDLDFEPSDETIRRLQKKPGRGACPAHGADRGPRSNGAAALLEAPVRLKHGREDSQVL